jgi:hypothetical protein
MRVAADRSARLQAHVGYRVFAVVRGCRVGWDVACRVGLLACGLVARRHSATLVVCECVRGWRLGQKTGRSSLNWNSP